MRTLITISAFIFSLTTVGAEPELIPEISAELKLAIEQGDARAISVGLYENGGLLFTGFGRLSRDDDTQPDADTVYEIGSIGKVFTALLAQTQVDASRLAWDDAIAKHLPDVEFSNRDVGAITLRELASHTSGLPRVPDNMPMSDPMDPYADYGLVDLLSFLAGYKPVMLNKEYNYSNLGAGLLGVIAADVAGLPYGEAMKSQVLRPLGMTSTGVEVRDDQADRFAHGFSGGADMPAWSGFDAMAGAGALRSTARDMLKFVQQNIDPQALAESLTAIREPQGKGETAFGWHIETIEDGGPIFWHNGGTGGYASFLAIRPDTRAGVVLLSTSTEYNAITALGLAQISGRVSSSNAGDLAPYPGAYKIADAFILTISIDAGQLVAQATGQAPFPLTKSAENEFVFLAADVRIGFDVTDAGRADGLTLYQGGQALPAPRVADELGMQTRTVINVSESILSDYAGHYQLTPEAIITIIARGEQLYAQLTGQGAIPVFAYEADRFFYKVVDAQLHFERDENNEVVAVVLHQGREQRAPRTD